MDTQLKRRFPLCSRLLRLYPASYRNRYGDEILQTLADMLDYATSPAERRRVWARTILDLPLAATQQQLITIGETMHQSPLIKRGSLTGTLLLLPFFAAITANGLDKVLRHQTLYHSGLWSMPWLAIWVLYLPLLAGSIALASMLIVLRPSRRQQTHVTAAWPLAGVLVAAIGILGMLLFHDSVHCVTGSPIRELQHMRTTVSCIEQR